MGQRGVVVSHERVVVAGEAVSGRGADERGVAGVRVPGLGDLPTMPGGEEVVGAALDHVEAERAAVTAAVDCIPRREQGSEQAGDVLDPDRADIAACGPLDRGYLG